MANKLTISLTPDQQKQIKDATGQNVAELNIDLASTGGLSQEELDQVAGGIIVVCQKGAPSAAVGIGGTGGITGNTITGNITGGTFTGGL